MNPRALFGVLYSALSPTQYPNKLGGGGGGGDCFAWDVIKSSYRLNAYASKAKVELLINKHKDGSKIDVRFPWLSTVTPTS